MRKAKMIILVGVQGSGKTTYANYNFNKEGYVILSSDEIRVELFKDEPYNPSQNAVVFDTLFSRLIENLRNNITCVIDATNISKRNRERFITIGKQEQVKIEAHILDTHIEDCIIRDGQRERTVGEEVIRKYQNYFESPSREEGFDSIILVKN